MAINPNIQDLESQMNKPVSFNIGTTDANGNPITQDYNTAKSKFDTTKSDIENKKSNIDQLAKQQFDSQYKFMDTGYDKLKSNLEWMANYKPTGDIRKDGSFIRTAYDMAHSWNTKPVQALGIEMWGVTEQALAKLFIRIPTQGFNLEGIAEPQPIIDEAKNKLNILNSTLQSIKNSLSSQLNIEENANKELGTQISQGVNAQDSLKFQRERVANALIDQSKKKSVYSSANNLFQALK